MSGLAYNPDHHGYVLPDGRMIVCGGLDQAACYAMAAEAAARPDLADRLTVPRADTGSGGPLVVDVWKLPDTWWHLVGVLIALAGLYVATKKG